MSERDKPKTNLPLPTVEPLLSIRWLTQQDILTINENLKTKKSERIEAKKDYNKRHNSEE